MFLYRCVSALYISVELIPGRPPCLLHGARCHNDLPQVYIATCGSKSHRSFVCSGNNHLNKLDRMLYLRQFNNLESVNLAGNPICREANYKSYMLSHMKYLKYLDYVRVKADDVQAAIEHHQDEASILLLYRMLDALQVVQ